MRRLLIALFLTGCAATADRSTGSTHDPATLARYGHPPVSRTLGVAQPNPDDASYCQVVVHSFSPNGTRRLELLLFETASSKLEARVLARGRTLAPEDHERSLHHYGGSWFDPETQPSPVPRVRWFSLPDDLDQVELEVGGKATLLRLPRRRARIKQRGA